MQTAELKRDGVEIEARQEYDFPEFYVVVECPTCGDKTYQHASTFADIGCAIQEGYLDCLVCTMSTVDTRPASKDEALASIAEHVKRITDVLDRLEIVDGVITVHSFNEPYA